MTYNRFTKKQRVHTKFIKVGSTSLIEKLPAISSCVKVLHQSLSGKKKRTRTGQDKTSFQGKFLFTTNSETMTGGPNVLDCEFTTSPPTISSHFKPILLNTKQAWTKKIRKLPVSFYPEHLETHKNLTNNLSTFLCQHF